MSDKSRFVVASGAAVVGSLLALVTVFLRYDWIEVVLRIDPDGGSGSVEWLTLAGLALVVVSCVVRRRQSSVPRHGRWLGEVMEG
jgi:hypothetical protein